MKCSLHRTYAETWSNYLSVKTLRNMLVSCYWVTEYGSKVFQIVRGSPQRCRDLLRSFESFSAICIKYAWHLWIFSPKFHKRSWRQCDIPVSPNNEHDCLVLREAANSLSFFNLTHLTRPQGDCLREFFLTYRAGISQFAYLVFWGSCTVLLENIQQRKKSYVKPVT